jgi:membrane protease YdiL (CAAX protease family)
MQFRSQNKEHNMNDNTSWLLTSRSRWARFLRHPLTRTVIASFGVAMAAGLSYSLASAVAPREARIMWPHLLAALAVVVAYWGYVRLFEGRQLSEFGFRGATTELAFGSAIGAGAVVAVLSILFVGRAYQPVSLNPLSLAIILPLAEMAFVGVFEEVLCRAIIFRIVEQSFGTRAALIVSALLFGLAHIPGGGLSALGLAVTMIAGLAFSAAFVLTRRLWLCIGIHAAWNYTLGSIFSISVSGHAAQGLVNAALNGPDWLTGGAYGLEGSAVTLVVLGLIAAVLLQIALRKDKFISMRALSAVQIESRAKVCKHERCNPRDVSANATYKK